MLVCLGGGRKKLWICCPLNEGLPFLQKKDQNQLSSMFLGGEYHRSVVTSKISYCWIAGSRGKNSRREKYPRKSLARMIAGLEAVLSLLLRQLFAVFPEDQSRHCGSRGSSEAALGQMRFWEEIT